MSATYTCRECGEDVPLATACCGFREVVRFDESSARHLSYTDIDVGFNLAASGIPIKLPPDVEAVRFVDRRGSLVIRFGSWETRAGCLRQAGYRVVPS